MLKGERVLDPKHYLLRAAKHRVADYYSGRKQTDSLDDGVEIVDEKALEQSPGWLNSSAKPGQEGVCVVYGHRNRNHLQVLKDVSYGDKILVSMPDGKTYTYVIESTEILESNDDLRIPTIEGKHLMLTTCYPFYYTGHAPKKYVVIAVLS